MYELDDMRALVQRGYEVNAYAEHFREEPVLCDREIERLGAFHHGLPMTASLLDLGSGTGMPYDRWLVDRGFCVTGIEFSRQMVARAQHNVPEADYVLADMLQVELCPESFQGILCLYALFHLPRERHQEMLARMARWLAPDSPLLITLGMRGMVCDVDPDWCGAPMAWSSYEPATYERCLTRMGLAIERRWVEGAPGEQEHHLWVLARKIGGRPC